jgi:hypothetical protein
MVRRSGLTIAIFGDDDEFLVRDDEGSEGLTLHQGDFEEGVEVFWVAVYTRGWVIGSDMGDGRLRIGEGGRGKRTDLQSFIGFWNVNFESFAEESVVGLDGEVEEDVLEVGFDCLEVIGVGCNERHFEIGSEAGSMR